jgi:hypothetical protein
MYPKKFKKLMEAKLQDVERPDYCWVVYAVCSCSKDACGWHGWMLDGIFTGKRGNSRLLASVSPFNCPDCGRPLFRTEAVMRMQPSTDQSPELEEGIDYIKGDVVYSDDE